MTTTTQTTLLTRGNFGAIGGLLCKVLGAPILAATLLIAPYAWVAGWLPIKSAMPYKLLTLIGEDNASAGPVYASEAFDPHEWSSLDRRSLWRVQLRPDVIARFIANRGLSSVGAGAVPNYFWTQSPIWWPRSAGSSARFYRTEGWDANARGEDDLSFLMMYDETEGAAYFFVKDNF